MLCLCLALWSEATSEKVTSVFKFEALPGYRDETLGRESANGGMSLASLRSKRKEVREGKSRKQRVEGVGKSPPIQPCGSHCHRPGPDWPPQDTQEAMEMKGALPSFFPQPTSLLAPPALAWVSFPNLLPTSVDCLRLFRLPESGGGPRTLDPKAMWHTS